MPSADTKRPSLRTFNDILEQVGHVIEAHVTDPAVREKIAKDVLGIRVGGNPKPRKRRPTPKAQPKARTRAKPTRKAPARRARA